MRVDDEMVADAIEWVDAEGDPQKEIDAVATFLPTGDLLVMGDRKLVVASGALRAIHLASDVEIVFEDDAASRVGKSSRENAFREAVLAVWDDHPELWQGVEHVIAHLGLQENKDVSSVKRTLAHLARSKQLTEKHGTRKGTGVRWRPQPDELSRADRDARLREALAEREEPRSRDWDRECWWNGPDSPLLPG